MDVNVERIDIHVDELVLGGVEGRDVEPLIAGLRRELTRLFGDGDLETLLAPDGDALGAALSEGLASMSGAVTLR